MRASRLAIDDGAFNVNKITIAPPPDADDDRVPDRVDNCPLIPNADQADYDGDGADACVLSVLPPTVVIDGCDSRTPNLSGADGCTFSDDLAAEAAGAANHGGFVRDVARIMSAARKAGLISGVQYGAVVRCAAGTARP